MSKSDLCDLCQTANVTADRVTYCGKTIGQECGCSDSNEEGICYDTDCLDCYPREQG